MPEVVLADIVYLVLRLHDALGFQGSQAFQPYGLSQRLCLDPKFSEEIEMEKLDDPTLDRLTFPFPFHFPSPNA